MIERQSWLIKRQSPVLPTPPMQRFDRLALLILALALLLWLAAPGAPATRIALLVAAALHFWRLSRWAGAEPLLLVLHAGYAFVPLEVLAVGAAILWPDALPMAAAQHVWMSGALGLMTLSVMTRATLGHTGHALTAKPGTVAIYLLILSVAARVLAGPVPEFALTLSGI